MSRDFVSYRMTVAAHGPHIATGVNGHQLIDDVIGNKRHELLLPIALANVVVYAFALAILH